MAGNRAVSKSDICPETKPAFKLALFFQNPLQLDTVLATEKKSLQCLLISIGMHVFVIATVPAYENTGIGGSGQRAALRAELALPSQQKKLSKDSIAEQKSKAWIEPQGPTPPSLPVTGFPVTTNEGDSGTAPLIGLPIPATPPYFESMALSEKPEVVEDVPPTLNQFLQTQESGYAIMKLLINEQGGVDEAVIEASDLGDKDLQQLRAAFQGMKFRPGKIGQANVKTEMRIQISVEAIRKLRSQP